MKTKTKQVAPDKIMSGKELNDGGHFTDSDGYLIPSTSTFHVWFDFPKWKIINEIRLKK